MNNQPAWLTAKEAAAVLGVKTRTVYAYASRGLLESSARGPGTRALYSREAVETLQKRAAARAGHTAVAAAALRWGEPVLDSRITEITRRGPVYRGARALELVEQPFEAVAERVWDREVSWARVAPRVVVRAARPSLQALLEVLVASAPSLRATPWHDGAPALINRLACAAGPHERPAEKASTVAQRLAWSLQPAPTAPVVELINAGLVLLADHELNASTFAARIAASAGASWVDALISAWGPASGPRHASACDHTERAWNEVLAVRSVTRWVRRELEKGPLAGFDAGAYPRGDPRAQCLLERTRPFLSRVQRARLDDWLRCVDELTGQLPAVDLALGVTAQVLGLPRGAATSWFVVARTVGWVAHVVEQQESRDFIRPRARFVGERRE